MSSCYLNLGKSSFKVENEAENKVEGLEMYLSVMCLPHVLHGSSPIFSAEELGGPVGLFWH